MKKAKKAASAAQLEVAKRYRIPFSQAHTVNLKKVAEYQEFKKTAAEVVNDYLDNQHRRFE